MTGKILGFDTNENTGTLAGDNGQRYTFAREDWKEELPPQKEMKVDFDTEEGNHAKAIYHIKDSASENNEIMMGLLAVGLTFFLAFFGTFIVRLVLAKQPVGKTLMPTFIHFIATILVIIPVLGWVIYLVGTAYYMIKNYQLVMNDSYKLQNKYA